LCSVPALLGVSMYLEVVVEVEVVMLSGSGLSRESRVSWAPHAGESGLGGMREG
jgi:hypothetical protein